MLQGKGLRKGDRSGGKPRSPALFLKRYDSKRVRGRGSVNDMIPWNLGVRKTGVGIKGRKVEGVLSGGMAATIAGA